MVATYVLGTYVERRVGSSPTPGTKAYLAQLVELLICNQMVGGSSPSVGSTYFKHIMKARNTFLISIAIFIASCSDNSNTDNQVNDSSSSIKNERVEDTLDINDRISIDQFKRMDSLHAAGKL